MKILISIFIASSLLLVTSPAWAERSNDCKWNVPWNKACRKGEIERDNEGGYKQKSYKEEKAKTDDEKMDAGYYNGEYHMHGKKYKRHRYQVISE